MSKFSHVIIIDKYNNCDLKISLQWNVATIVTYWPLTEPSIKDAPVWKSERRSCDLIGSKWALWNNICRCPRQLSQFEAVKARVRASLQSVRAPRWGLLPPVGRPPVERDGVSEGRVKASLRSLRVRPLGPVAHIRPPIEQPWPRSRSAKWVLKITQRARVKRRS